MSVDRELFNKFECMIFEAVDAGLERHGFDGKTIIKEATVFLKNFIDCRISAGEVEYAYDLREAEYLTHLAREYKEEDYLCNYNV
jgi:hypothetical protein